MQKKNSYQTGLDVTRCLLCRNYSDRKRGKLGLLAHFAAVASAISTYRAEYVPGLLQTEAYDTALHRAALMNAYVGEISKQVAVRMARQHRLTEPGTPQLWDVLNEAVIRRLVGERAVMHAQLRGGSRPARRPGRP